MGRPRKELRLSQIQILPHSIKHVLAATWHGAYSFLTYAATPQGHKIPRWQDSIAGGKHKW